MVRRRLTYASWLLMAVAVGTSVLGFAADLDRVFIAGFVGLLVGAAASMIIEVTAPNPKDVVARCMASPADRARWDEATLTEAWADHVLCAACVGAKVCSGCGGEGGCAACDQRSWCRACGGAGQWPRDPAAPIYAPAPAQERPLD